MEKLLRANEVGELLGISRSAVFNLWKRGELPVIRIGKSVRCRPSDLEAYVASNSTNLTKNPLAVRATNRSEQVAHTSNGDTYA
jgi:excisionase family DNA binding protein